MNIAFLDPLVRGWNRMKKALFQPFDLSRWFAVGFTSFLAGLTDYHGTGAGDSKTRGHTRWDIEGIIDFPDFAWEWLMDNIFWFVLIAIGVIFLLILGLLLTWLSSRGKFMFLDNVIHNRSLVSKPWHQFRKVGNSLFAWRLIFGIVCFAVIIIFLIFCFMTLLPIFTGYGPGPAKIVSVVMLSLVFFVLLIIISYIDLFLRSFIIPIMYKKEIRVVQAWAVFLPVFTRHMMHFILYGLLTFLLNILIFICIVMFGFFTCCIGFIFLVIPYIGSVLLLPFHYTLRAFSLEFLGQFGPEFSLFPNEPPKTIEGH